MTAGRAGTGGRDPTSTLRSMAMLPTSRILTTVVASFALAAPASAADPLLSGYAGPGGGEQTLLGAEEPRAPSGAEGGSPRAPSGAEGGSPLAPSRAAVPEVGKAPAVIVDAAPLTPQPSKKRRERSEPDHRRSSDTAPAAASLATVSAVRYPAASADAWAFSLTDIVIGLMLALLVLVAVARGTARLGASPKSSRAADVV
jgi:multisubunit Na+/H+ antiporter MnhC subunit